MKQLEEPHSGSLQSYTLGFILSVIMTIIAYILTVNNLLTGNALVGVIVLLAISQLVVQLVFFLHLNATGSRLNLAVFSFMILIVLILVFGSIWIMNNLNTNMTPTQINTCLNSQDSL